MDKKNHVVVYGNEMNKAKFGGFSATDMDLFMSLCVIAKDQDTKQIEIDFSELRQIAHFRNSTTEEFYCQLNELRKKILGMTMTYESDEEEVGFVLFPTYRTNKKDKKLRIAVNEEFKYVLNQLSSAFTMFDLGVFASIKGKYGKTLYRMLAQYRQKNGSGWWQVDIKEFKNIFDVPESYKSKYIIEKVVKPAIKDINHLFGSLTYEAQYAKKRGKPLSGFRFEFTKAVNKPKVEENAPTALPEQAKQEKAKKVSKNKFQNYSSQRNYTKEQFAEMEKKIVQSAVLPTKSNEMTEEEKREFDELTKNGVQETLLDLLPTEEDDIEKRKAELLRQLAELENQKK